MQHSNLIEVLEKFVNKYPVLQKQIKLNEDVDLQPIDMIEQLKQTPERKWFKRQTLKSNVFMVAPILFFFDPFDKWYQKDYYIKNSEAEKYGLLHNKRKVTYHQIGAFEEANFRKLEYYFNLDITTAHSIKEKIGMIRSLAVISLEILWFSTESILDQWHWWLNRLLEKIPYAKITELWELIPTNRSLREELMDMRNKIKLLNDLTIKQIEQAHKNNRRRLERKWFRQREQRVIAAIEQGREEDINQMLIVDKIKVNKNIVRKAQSIFPNLPWPNLVQQPTPSLPKLKLKVQRFIEHKWYSKEHKRNHIITSDWNMTEWLTEALKYAVINTDPHKYKKTKRLIVRCPYEGCDVSVDLIRTIEDLPKNYPSKKVYLRILKRKINQQYVEHNLNMLKCIMCDTGYLHKKYKSGIRHFFECNFCKKVNKNYIPDNWAKYHENKLGIYLYLMAVRNTICSIGNNLPFEILDMIISKIFDWTILINYNSKAEFRAEFRDFCIRVQKNPPRMEIGVQKVIRLYGN